MNGFNHNQFDRVEYEMEVNFAQSQPQYQQSQRQTVAGNYQLQMPVNAGQYPGVAPINVADNTSVNKIFIYIAGCSMFAACFCGGIIGEFAIASGFLVFAVVTFAAHKLSFIWMSRSVNNAAYYQAYGNVGQPVYYQYSQPQQSPQPLIPNTISETSPFPFLANINPTNGVLRIKGVYNNPERATQNQLNGTEQRLLTAPEQQSHMRLLPPPQPQSPQRTFAVKNVPQLSAGEEPLTLEDYGPPQYVRQASGNNRPSRRNRYQH